MKKAIAVVFADRSFLQDTNIRLFKANMAKTARVQKKKDKRAKATYGSAFRRVLTLAQAAAARKEALEKKKAAKAKKLAITNKKIASAIKKKKMEEAKQERLQVHLVKKRQKEEEQQIRALNTRPQWQYSKNTQQELPLLGERTQIAFELQMEGV